jgi:hypothetical protein
MLSKFNWVSSVVERADFLTLVKTLTVVAKKTWAKCFDLWEIDWMESKLGPNFPRRSKLVFLLKFNLMPKPLSTCKNFYFEVQTFILRSKLLFWGPNFYFEVKTFILRSKLLFWGQNFYFVPLGTVFM